MGAVHADIELINVRDAIRAEEGLIREDQIRKASVRALVDTGATVLVIPDSLRRSLGLRTVARRPVVTADGAVQECDVVGPVEVRFGDRDMTGRAIVMPGEVEILFGQVQMEEMDLLVDPLGQKLIPNPASPDRARLMAVGVRLRGGFAPEPESRP